MSVLKTIKDFGLKLLELNKNVEENRSDIKKLTKQLEKLTAFTIKQSKRIQSLETELKIEREKFNNEREKYQLEIKNLKLELANKLKDFEISILKVDRDSKTSDSLKPKD